jgi:Ca2+-binding EF-hand superfamily protein
VDLDSEITLPDFTAALKPYHYTEEDMERMFIAMDLDGTGKVHYSEFLAGTLEAHGSISEERIAEAFDRLDSDATGYITKKNIMDFLGDAVSEDYANAIIDEADVYHDHRITYEEFLALWNEENDEKFKEALQDVNHRRVSFDDASIDDLTDGESIRTETSAESPSQESSMAIQSADTIDLGGGSFFFGVEKEKSMRGVWV